MKYAILDLRQEYFGPAKGFDHRAIVFKGGQGTRRSVLRKSELPNQSVADFDDGGHFAIKRAALGDIINLRRFRKRKARDEADRQAATNRASFGRTRADRERDKGERERLGDHLDQHRIEDEDRR